MIISIRTSLQIIAAGQTEQLTHWIADAGYGLALLTMLLQLLFAAKYALAVRTLLQKQAADGHVRGGLFAAPSFSRGHSLFSSRVEGNRGNRGQPVSQADQGKDLGLASAASGAQASGAQGLESAGGDGSGVCWRVGQRWDRFADWLDAKVGWSPGCRKLPLDRLKVIGRSSPLRPRHRGSARCPYVPLRCASHSSPSASAMMRHSGAATAPNPTH